mgnify:FL=1
MIHTLRQTGLLILEDNRLIIIVSSYKRGISMHVKYILMILIIFFISSGCASENNTSNITGVKESENIKYTPYTYSYDNELPLQKERKLTLEILGKSDEIKDTKDLYKVIINRKDGYKLELASNNSKFDYYYWGGVDKDYPNGYGVLIANNNGQKGNILLAGEFLDGVPLGYIQVFENQKIKYEGIVDTLGVKFIETDDNSELKPKNPEGYFDRLYFKKLIVHKENQYDTLFDQCIVLDDNVGKTTLIKKIIGSTFNDL